MDLAGIKARWNEVLDTLLESDRVAWIAFFMCLGGAIVVIIGVAILMISSDQ